MSQKKFSTRVMEVPLTALVSEGMFKKVKQRKKETGESFSNYIRTLIMNDLKIDYNGKETDTR